MKKRLIQKIAVIIALTFLGILLFKYWDELSHFHWKLNYFYLGLSVLFLSFLFFLGSWGWMLILHKLDIKISFKRSMEIWIASLIGKYIPGKVWAPLARIYLGKKLGISRTKMSLAIILEITLTGSSGIMIFFLSLLFWQQREYISQMWPFLILFLILSFIVMHPLVLQKIVNIPLKLLKKGKVLINITYKDILLLLSFYLFFWFCSGISIYFLTRSFYPVTIASIPVITGIWAISVLMGFMIFILPGGIGAREGMLIFLLSFLIPAHVALLVAIFSRILLTILEIAFIGILLNFDVSLSKYYKEIKLALPNQVDRS